MLQYPWEGQPWAPRPASLGIDDTGIFSSVINDIFLITEIIFFLTFNFPLKLLLFFFLLSTSHLQHVTIGTSTYPIFVVLLAVWVAWYFFQSCAVWTICYTDVQSFLVILPYFSGASRIPHTHCFDSFGPVRWQCGRKGS